MFPYVWRQPKYSSTDEQRCDTYIQWNITQPQKRMK